MQASQHQYGHGPANRTILTGSSRSRWIKRWQAPDVQGKREAARRWANHVSADEGVGMRWRYLLVSESDVQTAKGSWDALKTLRSR
jgi:hypothetical protein